MLTIHQFKSTTRHTFLIIMSLFFSSKNGRPKLLLFIQKPSLRVMFVGSRLNLGLDQRFLLPYPWQLLQEMLHRHTKEILVLPIHQQRNMQVWIYYSLKKTRFCHRILEIIFNMETERLLIPSVFCEQLSKDVVTWSNCNFNLFSVPAPMMKKTMKLFKNQRLVNVFRLLKT